MRHFAFLFALAIAIETSGAPDVQKLVQETQRTKHESSELVMVWWIPTEFWSLTLQNQPGMSEQQRSAFTKVLQDYTLFAVIASDTGAFGGLTPRGRSTILENIKFEVGSHVVPPLSASEISADATNFMLMMRPIMASMLGQLGESMEFVFYPNTGKSLINADKEGSFAFTAFGEKHEWRLPLGSLLPEKIDPATGEKFPGNFRYNPFTGSKLADQ
jgi:hypothetical protein